MPGMECWDSTYENTQGRAGLEEELKMLEGEYPGVKSYFDELNVDNLKKQAAEREQKLADSRTASRKLTNTIADSAKRLVKLNAELTRL